MCNITNFLFELNEATNTNCIKNEMSRVRATLFSEPVVNIWNSLPENTDFSGKRSAS